jgi:hypothetical protein
LTYSRYGSWEEFRNSLLVTRSVPNNPPKQPGNISASNGASGISLTPTLQSPAFSELDSGDSHATSQWQVTAASAECSRPVYDSGVDTMHVTAIVVPAGEAVLPRYYLLLACEAPGQQWRLVKLVCRDLFHHRCRSAQVWLARLSLDCCRSGSRSSRGRRYRGSCRQGLA